MGLLSICLWNYNYNDYTIREHQYNVNEFALIYVLYIFDESD